MRPIGHHRPTRSNGVERLLLLVTRRVHRTARRSPLPTLPVLPLTGIGSSASGATLASVKAPPTDYDLLWAIYEQHHDDFVHRTDARQTKVLVPLDVPVIAANLGIDPHSVVGRLYHHLDPIYAHEPDPSVGRTARKSLFALKAGNEVNCINFPLMEAVLAGLAQERRRNRWTVGLALVSLGIAGGSLVVAIASLIVAVTS